MNRSKWWIAKGQEEGGAGREAGGGGGEEGNVRAKSDQREAGVTLLNEERTGRGQTPT